MYENIRIANLPGDDTYYLVWKYAVSVKLNNESQIPNIQVVLRKIDFENGTFIKDAQDIIAYLPISELDEVRIGSVWKKKEKVLSKWQNYKDLEYQENVKFNFDFILNEPEIIRYDEIIQSLDTSLSNILKVNLPKFESKKTPFLNKTNYTKLIADNGINVLIPSIELFVSAYTPEHKTIKQRLLQFNIDDAIGEFIKFENTKSAEEGYQIGLHRRMEDSNIKFLAFAKFNKISRKRISLLSSSLELNEGDLIDGCQARYPKVLPYHPSHLFLESDGVWLNKNTYLVFRIYTINLPNDVSIKAIIENESYKVDEKLYKVEEKESDNNSKKDEDVNTNGEADYNLEKNINISNIDSNFQPNKRTSVPRIKTQVGIIDDIKPEIDIKKVEIPRTEYIEDNEAENTKQLSINNSEISQKTIESDIDTDVGSDSEVLSSGDYSSEMEYLSSYTDPETNILFNEIINILNELKIKNLILDYKFLDNEFNDRINSVKTTFYNTLFNNEGEKEELEQSWFILRERKEGELKKLGYREYFLIKIEFSFDKYFYLLEIGKKSTEGYLGVLLKNKLSNKLSKNKLIDLLKRIVNNEGNYRKKDPNSNSETKKLKAVDLGLEYKTYSHKFDEKSYKFINLSKTVKNKIDSLIND